MSNMNYEIDVEVLGLKDIQALAAYLEGAEGAAGELAKVLKQLDSAEKSSASSAAADAAALKNYAANMELAAAAAAKLNKNISSRANISTPTGSAANQRAMVKNATDLTNALQAQARAEAIVNDAYAEGAARAKAQETSDAALAAEEAKLAAATDEAWAAYTRRAEAEAVAQRASEAYEAQLAEEARMEAKLALAAEEAAAALTKTEDPLQHLAATRYALYDVSNTMGILSLATLGTATAMTVLDAKTDAAFTNVKRTLGGLANDRTFDKIKQQLIDLTTVMPVTTQQVADVAAAVGQLGLKSAQDLVPATDAILKFVAATGVDAQTATLSIGRIVDLTNAGEGNFGKVAAAIYQVGVTGAATEDQVLKTAQEIAAAGAQAGLTTKQVIGLAGAFSDLGVTPELARSAVQTTFALIEKAIAQGGDKLTGFAQLAGMSAKQFTSAWNTNALGTFQKFLDGVHSEGPAATLALSNLGLTAQRTGGVLVRLAQNPQTIASALKQADKGFSDDARLMGDYGQVADTVAAKATEFANSIKAIIEAGDHSEGLKGLFDVLAKASQGFEALAKTDVGSWLGTASLGFLALTGTITAVVSVVARGRAAVLAMVQATNASTQAMVANNAAGNGSVTAMQQLAQEWNARLAIKRALATAEAIDTEEIDANTVSLEENARAAAVLAALMDGVGASSIAAAGDVTVFSTALKAATISTGILAGVAILGTVAATIYGFVHESHESAADLSTSMKSLDDSIGKGLATDTANADAKFGHFALTLKNTGDAAQKASTQILSVGDATQKAVESELKNPTSSPFQTLLKDEQNFAQKYPQIIKTMPNISKLITEAIGGGDQLNTMLTQFQNTPYALSTAEGKAYYQVLEDAEAAAKGVGDTLRTNTNVNLLNFGKDTDAAAKKTASFISDLTKFTKAQLANVDATSTMNSAMYDLGQSVQQNGKDFSAYTDGGRQNLAALDKALSAAATNANGNELTFAQSVASIINGLEAEGVKGIAVLNNVRNALIKNLDAVKASIEATATGKVDPTSGLVKGVGQLSGVAQQQVNSINKVEGALKGAGTAATDLGKNAKTAGGQIDSGFTDSLKKADDAANKTAKDVRTLSDYASDIGNVFDALNATIYGKQNANDARITALQALKSQATDAKATIKSLRTEIDGLKADISSDNSSEDALKHQLAIAQEYGNTLEAESIQSQIAQLEADKNSKQNQIDTDQKGITKAQNTLTANGGLQLKGNTAGALANRAALQSLIEATEEQAEAMLASGEPAKKVEAWLENQKKNLGLGAQVNEQYAKAINDMVKSIKSVPTKITMKADTTPLQEAINKIREALKLKPLTWSVILGNTASSGTSVKKNATFAQGGLVSGPGTGTSDSIDAKLSDGEYVITAAAVRKYGTKLLDNLNAKNLNKPMFKAEGPQYYQRAFDYFSQWSKLAPNSWDLPYQTTLSAAMERKFDAWVRNKSVPFQLNSRLTDYDMRGYYKATSGKSWNGPGAHFPDTWKTPYDTTFSNQSKYSLSNNPNKWIGDRLINTKTGQVIFDPNWYVVSSTQGFAEGGYTGSGGKYQPAGVVHRGEYVMTAAQTRALGVPFLNALGASTQRGYAGGGQVGASVSFPGSIMVELSPADRALLSQNGSATLVVDGKVLATTVNNENKRSSVRGR